MQSHCTELVFLCLSFSVSVLVPLQDVCNLPALLVAHCLHVDTCGFGTFVSYAHRDARYQPWSHEVLLYNGLWAACCGCWSVSRRSS